MNKWEAKREYAANVMADEARKVEDILTAGQIDIIASVRTMRHRIHADPKGLFFSESASYDEYLGWLYDYRGHDGIAERLKKVNRGARAPLSERIIPYDVETLTTDCNYYYQDDIGEGEVGKIDYDTVFCSAVCEYEDINDALETWLVAVDKMYGTSFAPTGWARINE